MTQPEGAPQNPQYNGGPPGFTPPANNQPPAGYPFQPPPTQQFGVPQPQSPYVTPQGSWQPSAQPGAGPPTPPSRPWFKRKRFVIPAGVLALGVIAAVASPKSDTGTTPSSSAAASTTKDYGYLSGDPKDISVAPTTEAAPPTTTAASSSVPVAETSAPTSKRVPAPAPKPAPKPAPAPAPKPAPAPNLTVSQENALRSAKDYLAFASFSRSGLINQVEFDGYSASDATWAVDTLHVDWNQQAAKAAKDYLDFTSFSHSGLVQQLEFDGFTSAQAEYGVSQTGL